LARALFGARLCGHRVLLVTGGLAGSNGLLDIFEREKQLVRIEAFRAAPELRASQLAQQVPWSIVLHTLRMLATNAMSIRSSRF